MSYYSDTDRAEHEEEKRMSEQATTIHNALKGQLHDDNDFTYVIKKLKEEYRQRQARISIWQGAIVHTFITQHRGIIKTDRADTG